MIKLLQRVVASLLISSLIAPDFAKCASNDDSRGSLPSSLVSVPSEELFVDIHLSRSSDGSSLNSRVNALESDDENDEQKHSLGSDHIMFPKTRERRLAIASEDIEEQKLSLPEQQAATIEEKIEKLEELKKIYPAQFEALTKRRKGIAQQIELLQQFQHIKNSSQEQRALTDQIAELENTSLLITLELNNLVPPETLTKQITQLKIAHALGRHIFDYMHPAQKHTCFSLLAGLFGLGGAASSYFFMESIYGDALQNTPCPPQLLAGLYTAIAALIFPASHVASVTHAQKPECDEETLFVKLPRRYQAFSILTKMLMGAGCCIAAVTFGAWIDQYEKLTEIPEEADIAFCVNFLLNWTVYPLKVIFEALDDAIIRRVQSFPENKSNIRRALLADCRGGQRDLGQKNDPGIAQIILKTARSPDTIGISLRETPESIFKQNIVKANEKTSLLRTALSRGAKILSVLAFPGTAVTIFDGFPFFRDNPYLLGACSAVGSIAVSSFIVLGADLALKDKHSSAIQDHPGLRALAVGAATAFSGIGTYAFTHVLFPREEEGEWPYPVRVAAFSPLLPLFFLTSFRLALSSLKACIYGCEKMCGKKITDGRIIKKYLEAKSKILSRLNRKTAAQLMPDLTETPVPLTLSKPVSEESKEKGSRSKSRSPHSQPLLGSPLHLASASNSSEGSSIQLAFHLSPHSNVSSGNPSISGELISGSDVEDSQDFLEYIRETPLPPSPMSHSKLAACLRGAADCITSCFKWAFCCRRSRGMPRQYDRDDPDISIYDELNQDGSAVGSYNHSRYDLVVL